MVLLEAQLRPLVQAESSVIVDVLYRPEHLFPPGTDARKKCENGGFIRRYLALLHLITARPANREFSSGYSLIKHTERLLEDKEEKLCIQVLHTLRQMMNFDIRNGDKVHLSCRYLLFFKTIVYLY